jgi:transposase
VLTEMVLALDVLRVLRTIGPKYACRGRTDGVVQAKVLPRLIESGMASTALVSDVVVSKFAWYLPLYRQVQILAGQGVHLDRATLAGWVRRAGWWLKSLSERRLPRRALRRRPHEPASPSGCVGRRPPPCRSQSSSDGLRDRAARRPVARAASSPTKSRLGKGFRARSG